MRISEQQCLAPKGVAAQIQIQLNGYIFFERCGPVALTHWDNLVFKCLAAICSNNSGSETALGCRVLLAYISSDKNGLALHTSQWDSILPQI